MLSPRIIPELPGSSDQYGRLSLLWLVRTSIPPLFRQEVDEEDAGLRVTFQLEQEGEPFRWGGMAVLPHLGRSSQVLPSTQFLPKVPVGRDYGVSGLTL